MIDKVWRIRAAVLRRGAWALCLMCGACATAPAVQPVAGQPAPLPSTRVYFYPKQGQSPEQQDRDRYACYLWAVGQTGFDPSRPNLAPHQQVRVVPVPPPGHDTAVGALAGAAIGAAVSDPGNKLGGAAVGAVAGAAIGAASDADRQQRAERLQQGYDQAYAAQQVRIDRQARDYRRAMAACLEGRGYAVRE